MEEVALFVVGAYYYAFVDSYYYYACDVEDYYDPLAASEGHSYC